MEATYSISTFIKSKNAGDNKALIYVRITINGERTELSIKRRVDRDRWDAAANRIRGNKEDAREINALLDATTFRLNKIYNKLLENNEHITAKRIKDIYFGKDESRKTLLEAFTDHNQMMASRVGVDFSKSTYTRYSTTKDHIEAFMRHQYKLQDIKLRQLRYSFITDLEHFLKVIRKCNHNSALKYIPEFQEDHKSFCQKRLAGQRSVQSLSGKTERHQKNIPEQRRVDHPRRKNHWYRAT
jgi:hypothetical protein